MIKNLKNKKLISFAPREEGTIKKPIIINFYNKMEKKHNNKGVGAGGAKTNENGLAYEYNTDLNSEFDVVKSDIIDNTKSKKNKSNICRTIKFKKDYNNNRKFLCLPKGALYKWMEKQGERNTDIVKAHGCKEPDEAYCYPSHNGKGGILFIVEKKCQTCPGSVCEKLPSACFKKSHYKKQFPNYKIYYIYSLSDWFNNNCKAELEYLDENNIKYFWGNTEEYKNKLVKFILETVEINLNSK